MIYRCFECGRHFDLEHYERHRAYACPPSKDPRGWPKGRKRK
jgi:DNA-directed RNA polymerase subunit RPC12/RpoP